LPAEQAYAVWLPKTGAVRLHLTSELAGDPAGDEPGLRLLDLPNIEHLLIDADGHQHVVLRSGARRKQFVIVGSNALVTPVTFGIRLCGRSDIATLAGELADLHSFLSVRRSRAAKPCNWAPRAALLRDALVALDGHRAGAKQRDIAVVICGREWVERDWPDRGLRLRVYRAIERGEELCNGGYRELLRKRCSI
jgi:hypothetical protein